MPKSSRRRYRPRGGGATRPSTDRERAALVAYLEAMKEAPYAAVEPSTRPPTVLAALGPRMLRLSAEAADGAHPYFTPPEHTATAREILGKGPLLAPEQMVVIDTDLERARGVARASMARYLRLPEF